MNFKSPSSGITFVTTWVRTDERFFTGMSELMGLEMTFGNELLATLATIEGSLTSMCSHVSFQIASL